MTLSEVIAAATVLAVATGGALQLWSGALAASAVSQRQQLVLERLEAQLLRSRARLRHAAAAAVAAAPPAADCAAAATWMAAELGAADLAPPAGLLRQVEAQPEALVRLVLRDGATGLERQRRWSPVAFGLCSARPLAADGEPER